MFEDDKLQPARERLSQAMQDSFEDHPGVEGDCILTGMVTVFEYLDSDGLKNLGLISSNPQHEPCPMWTTNGYLHYGLHNFFDSASEYPRWEDEEEDET